MKCPTCEGSKTNIVFVDYADGHGDVQRRACETCRGIGEITDEQATRIAEGEQLREDRLNRRMTLRQEAERLGISVVELSRRERGLL